MNKILSIKKIKQGKELVFQNKGEEALYKVFVSSLKEGQVVEEFIESQSDTGTWLQLAKIHRCIKELALEAGYTAAIMKAEVKKHAGLCWKTKENQYCKSFAECSKEELSLTIESIIEIGDMIGINYRGTFPVRK
jgi:hypothetical protein